MNTQLILFPQNYNGYSFDNVQQINEYVANKTFFAPEISTVPMSSSGYPYAPSLFGSFPPQTGNWRLFYTESTTATFSATTIPTITPSTNTLQLHSSAIGVTAEGSRGGAYQQLTLTNGAQYVLTIQHSVLPSNSVIIIGVKGQAPINFDTTYIGTTGNQPTFINTSGNTSTTMTFTATHSVQNLVISYTNVNAATIDITEISVTELPSTVPSLAENLFDGQVICDLYEEQDIPLTLSIDNFKNVAEKTQSHSKDFNLPATKRNNKIFTHIFDVQKTIDNVYDFNPYLRTKAILKQNGLLIFEGTLRLIEIKDDNGEISYNVNLFTETVALKDVLEGRTLADLNLSELDHAYNYTNITKSWQGFIELQNNLAADSFAKVSGLAINETNVIKYPFCDWTGTIDCTGSKPEINRLEDAFRPWISVNYLLKNIARNSGYTFVSEFFDSAEFSKLYMDFNWGSEDGPTDFRHTGGALYHDGHGNHYAGTSATTWVWVHDQSPDDFDADTGWSLADNKFTAQQTNTYYVLSAKCSMLNISGSTQTVNYIRFVRNNVSGVFGTAGTFDYFAEITNFDIPNNQTYTPVFTASIPLGVSVLGADELYVEWEAVNSNSVLQNNSGTGFGAESTLSGAVYNNAEYMTSQIFNTARGEIKQWEFLSGIMKMFNLITLPDPTNPNNIIFEPYPDMFVNETAGTTLEERSIQLNWTDKIDASKIDLKPMDLKREVTFKYVFDEEDYALKKYKTAAQGFEYGSFILPTSSAIPGSNQVTNLVGTEEIIAEPFSATIIKPIQDLFSNFIVPVIYGSTDDGFEFNAIDNAPRILYNNGLTSQDYVVPGQNGVAGGTKTEYLQFSHFSDLPADNTDNDYNFGVCPVFPGVVDPFSQPVKNLYRLYHEPYFNELYNVNTRTMTCKVYLTPSDINTFDFRHKVMIKNKVYRVNKIDYKPNALSKVEFILLP